MPNKLVMQLTKSRPRTICARGETTTLFTSYQNMIALLAVDAFIPTPRLAQPGQPAAQMEVLPRVRMGLFDFIGNGGKPESEQETPKGFAAVSHILLTGTDAVERAEALKARLDANELSFGEAAVQFSECRSKGKMGNLGAFRGPTSNLPLGLGRIWNLPYEGKEVPEFDSLVFSPATPLNVVSVVTTAWGTHLVKVNARGPPDA